MLKQQPSAAVHGTQKPATYSATVSLQPAAERKRAPKVKIKLSGMSGTNPVAQARWATATLLRPGGVFVCTFSNRCFPTKAIRGWLMTDDAGHCSIVSTYFAESGMFEPATVDARIPLGAGSDPLYAVYAPVS